jgi:hypothetical protein
MITDKEFWRIVEAAAEEIRQAGLRRAGLLDGRDLLAEVGLKTDEIARTAEAMNQATEKMNQAAARLENAKERGE